MAERFNQIGVDRYTIQINENGEIVLDTGAGGKVKITGDLDVFGATTTVESTEVSIADKTLTINSNDPGGDGGITDLLDGYDRQAGLIIGRGPDRFDARVFYDEDISTIRAGSKPDSTEGAFIFKLGNGDYAGIHASSIMTDVNEDLYLLGQGTGVVVAFDTTDYERQIWNYTSPDPLDKEINFLAGAINAGKEDALINATGVVEYVDSYHEYFFQSKIEKDDSSVEVFDADIDGGDTKVVITLDGTNFTNFFDSRVEFGTLRVINDPGDIPVVTTSSIDTNIRLRGSGTGQVQIDGWQNLMLESDPADPPAEGVTIYSKTLGDGGTGLYFINQDGTQDEFVSRNKALLYSIIF